MSTSPSTALVSSLREWHHVAGLGTILLYRINQEIAWTRDVPTPANNIVAEALTLAGAACGLQPFDEQRVAELVSVKTGTSASMVFKEAEAKILGRGVDLALRMIARRDQSVHCAARLADLMIELVRHLYADPGAVERERAHQGQLARAIAAVGAGPVTIAVMQLVPEYHRSTPAPFVVAARGRDWTHSFGPGASVDAGPMWNDPFDDRFLEDGRDPQTTRKGHVEGW